MCTLWPSHVVTVIKNCCVVCVSVCCSRNSVLSIMEELSDVEPED